MGPELIFAFQIIDGLLRLAERIPEIKAEAAELRARVQRMLDEKRNPTPEEWTEIHDETAALLARF
jgi:hypothetical protein